MANRGGKEDNKPSDDSQPKKESDQGDIEDLLNACHDRDGERVKKLLASGLDPNQRNKDGFSPLQVSAEVGNLSTAELLLREGAQVDFGHKNGSSPLYVAAQNNHLAVAEVLIKHGAKVDLARDTRDTPLTVAAANGNTDVVNVLIEHKATVNAQNKTGATPLYVAAQNNHVPALEVLIKHGAKVDLARDTGDTPLNIAAAKGNTDVVNLLIEHKATVNVQNKEGVTPLFVAAQNNHVPALEVLIKHGGKVDLARDTGGTPLFIASQEGHLPVVQTLLQHGAKVDLAKDDGATPLIIAAEKGNTDVVNLLIEHKATVNAQKKTGATPLYVAAQNNHVPALEVLIKHGAKVDLARDDDTTPLYSASQHGHLPVVQTLLQHGAKVDLATDTGVTPLIIAAQNGHTDVINLLLQHRASVNTRDKWGETALDTAIRKKHIEVANILRNAPPKTEVKDTPDTAVAPLPHTGDTGDTELTTPQEDIADRDEAETTTALHTKEDGSTSPKRTFVLDMEVLRVKMEEAMRRGVSELDVTTVMASGIPGSGKTTLRYFLFGELPPDIRISTACIESAQRGIIEVIGPQGGVTVLKGVKDMTPVLASTVKEMEVSAQHDDQVPGEESITVKSATSTASEEMAPKLQERHSAESDATKKESVSRDEVTRMEKSAPKLQERKSSEANGAQKEPATNDESTREESGSEPQPETPRQSPPESHEERSSPLEAPSDHNRAHAPNREPDFKAPSSEPPTSGSGEPEGIPLSTTTLSSKKAILDWLEKHKGSLQLKGHWVHFIDSGGQQQFLEILPCLIRNIGLLMLVFKLSEKLSERTVVEYWDPNGGHYLGQFSISTEKLLAFTAQLSRYHQPKINLPHVQNPSDPRLKMVVVGTFKDQENQCEESRQEKNERLEQTLALFQDQLIRPGPGSSCAGGVIFALNASLAGKGDQEEEKVGNELRTIIKCVAPKYTFKMPMQYVFLEVELQKEAVVSKSHCWEVARELHFKTEEDLEYCLSYLHQVNLFFYYRECLPDTVITQPDVVVNVITQIFQYHLHLSENVESTALNEAEKVFLNQAIFSMDLLQLFKFKYSKKVLPDGDLMKLFQHRLIVAPVPAKASVSQYYMPSLLAEIPPEILRKIYKPESDLSSPLIISFPGLWAPNGVPTALVNKMLRYEGNVKFELAATKQQCKCVQKLVKNVTYMKVAIGAEKGDLTVVNLMEHIEVYTNNLAHHHLPLIEDVLDENLREVYATLSYDVTHEFGVLCKCGGQPRHSAHLSYANRALTCSLTDTTYFNPEVPRGYTPYSKPARIERASHVIEPISRRYSHHQYDDKYPGICFLGNPLKYEVGSEGADISPPDLGISLKVPPDAVLPEKTVNVTIRPCLSGPFRYPDSYKPRSALYLIAADSSFEKKVELRLQHYGQLETDEQARQMTFVSAQTYPDGMHEKDGYTFEVLKRGKFIAGQNCGTLALEHFCLKGVASEEKAEISKNYSVLYSKSDLIQDRQYAAIGVSLTDNVFMVNFREVVREHFRVPITYKSRLIQFRNATAQVVLPSHLNGWDILPDSVPCSFQRKEVDIPEWNAELGQSKYDYPPRFTFTLIPSEDAEPCMCQLQLTGMTEDVNFQFELRPNKPSKAKASNLFRRSPMKTSGGVQEPSGPPHSPYRYTPYTPRAQQRPSQSLSPGATSQLSPSTPVHQQPPLTPQYSPQAGAYSPLSVPPQSVDVPDRGGDMSLLGVPSPPQGVPGMAGQQPLPADKFEHSTQFWSPQPQPVKVPVGGGDMPVLSMPNLTHHQQQQQQQQTLPTDQYGYSTAQPWPPLPQLADVPVGCGDMSLHQQQQQQQPLPPDLYGYSSAQPLPQLPVPPISAQVFAQDPALYATSFSPLHPSTLPQQPGAASSSTYSRMASQMPSVNPHFPPTLEGYQPPQEFSVYQNPPLQQRNPQMQSSAQHYSINQQATTSPPHAQVLAASSRGASYQTPEALTRRPQKKECAQSDTTYIPDVTMDQPIKRFPRNDKPDLVKLFNFPVTPQSSQDIIERISAHYIQLGTILLQDGTGEIVPGIALSHNYRAPACMYAIMCKWLNGSGRTPISWTVFVRSLKDAKLFSVASAIEAVLI